MNTKSKLKNKKVLVTGGCGFIGFNLIQDLLEEGAKITVLDLPESDWGRLPDGVLQIKANILFKSEMKNRLKDFNVIYHLAARTDLNGKSVSEYSENYIGTQNILEEISTNVLERFVFYSTILVNGIFNNDSYITEVDSYKTNTHYGESKVLGEKVVMQYCKKNDVDYTIIRPASIYGPWGESPYSEFFHTIKQGRYFHVGKADNLVAWCYVKNLTGFTIKASVSEKAKNEIFYGTDQKPYSMREIVDQISGFYKIKIYTIPSFIMTVAAYFFGLFKKVGINVPIYPSRLRNIKATYRYSMQKSFIIGYTQKYNLRQGVEETLRWYEKNGYRARKY